MKKELLLILTVISAIVCQAQINEKDAVVNVVAYFHKGDTLVYNHTTQKVKYEKNDTLFDAYLGSEFQLVVLDETDKGYRIEYTPLSYFYAPDSLLTEKGKLSTAMVKAAEKKLGFLKAIFVTNEFGTVQRIENYKELSKKINNTADAVIKEMYAQMPILEKIISKNTMKQQYLSNAKTQESILATYDEMETLFGIHGLAPKLGDTTTVDGNTKTYVYSGKDQPDEYGTEGDYVVYVQEDINFTAEQVKEFVGQQINLFDGALGKEISEAWQKGSSAIPAMSVTSKNVIRYWNNGWPKEATTTKSVKLENEKEPRPIEIRSFEWTRRVF